MLERLSSSKVIGSAKSAVDTDKQPSSVRRLAQASFSGDDTGPANGNSTDHAPLRIGEVSKRYQGVEGDLAVLKDLSFSVADQEFVVLLGPSGCGKTTILKILAGLVQPTAGAVFRNGRVIDGPDPDIAMVFQDFVLLPWKTVLENVMLGQKVQNQVDKSTRRSLAKRWIEKVGLDGFEHRYPKELSGGMKQRVGLARALSVNPEVLLMDEPFGSLDAQTRDRLQTELLELWHEERKTILFVTHDIDEAIFLGDRIMVLSEKPSSIKASVSVEIDRPRWNRRLDIEQSDEFRRIKERLRSELGLVPA